MVRAGLTRQRRKRDIVFIKVFSTISANGQDRSLRHTKHLAAGDGAVKQSAFIHVHISITLHFGGKYYTKFILKLR